VTRAATATVSATMEPMGHTLPPTGPRPSTRQLTARMRAADRAVRDTGRAYQAAIREWKQAQAALVARLAEPRVSLLELLARHFTPAPPEEVQAADLSGTVTCWAENRSAHKPWVHAARPGTGTTVCGKAAGPPAAVEATCPACLGIPWPKRR